MQTLEFGNWNEQHLNVKIIWIQINENEAADSAVSLLNLP